MTSGRFSVFPVKTALFAWVFLLLAATGIRAQEPDLRPDVAAAVAGMRRAVMRPSSR